MPASRQRSLTKPLEPSSTAAAFDGPRLGMPAASSTSHKPPTSWASAAMTAKSIRASTANLASAAKSVAGMGTHSATSAIPALPGAQVSFVSSGLCESAQASACSRPPEPTNNTLTSASPFFAVTLYHSPMSETASSANLPEFSVTELSAALKRAVEDQFAMVRVRGEISGLKFHSSGHVYFDLKDDKAVLNAVIWRGVAGRLRLRPEAGMEVICTGKLSTYAGSSRYQLIVEQVELAGLGALMALLEERRKKLAAEGLFDASRKKNLPFLPEVIGVITSPTGAVIRDIMHRLEARFPRRVLLWPVAVQGETAAAQIAAAIAGFNAFGGHLPKPDLIIVARGGGSVEDLMAFNDEAVVRAAAAASLIPLISAVGHETDTTLIDFAADVRAPTPSAAAEMAVPVRSELISQTLDFERRMLGCFTRSVDQRRRHLAQLARVLPRPEQL